MYLPKHHALTDPGAMQAHIEKHPLGAWVCLSDGNLVANHIPFFLDRGSGSQGRLMGHVSRANPVWRLLTSDAPSVVMFMGPHAYITPSWYPGKQAHGQVVPTWNYATVHAHGVARAVEDPDWLLDMLQRLTDAQEWPRPTPWRVTDAPSAYIQPMLRAVIGIEITIDRLEGRLKVSQDEALADRQGTVAGLMQEPDTQAQAVAELVRQAMATATQR
jgi:transcriptional regulator